MSGYGIAFQDNEDGVPYVFVVVGTTPVLEILEEPTLDADDNWQPGPLASLVVELLTEAARLAN